MKKFALLSAAMLLAGCTQSIETMSYSELKDYAAEMIERCREQGVLESELEACAKQEMRADQARITQRQQFGAALAQAGDNYSRSVQANRPINCTSTASSTWVGGAPSRVNTTCY